MRALRLLSIPAIGAFLLAALAISSAAPGSPADDAPRYVALDATAALPALFPAPWAPPPTLHPWGPPPEVSALSAIVIDEASGAVLYEKDAHRRLPPASLTKIASAIIALRDGDPSAWVWVDVDHRDMPGSSVMGLESGDVFSQRDLLYGMMLPSGNDAALALARAIAGSDEAFVGRMNALSWNLGLRDTRFANPHGLDAREHFSSAYDLAMLARYAMTYREFAQVVSTRRWTASGSREIAVRNINGFLYSYSGADGVKTGFTEEAGRTSVASASVDGRRVYAVVMNAAARDSDTLALMSWAFANFRWPAVTEAGG